MIWLLSILIVLYLTLLLFLLMGWESLPFFEVHRERRPSTFITVIIPARNEEKNIGLLLKDLAHQSYPGNLFEVIVADDHSEDLTGEIVKKYPNVKRIELSRLGKTGKKQAVEEAIKESKGELILCTDADCRVGTDWLWSMEDFYDRTRAKMICGPVCFTSGGSLWAQVQQIEFASLIGTGGASLALRVPNMCNGANIAYEKDAFFYVNGFAGNEDIASGDDEFLMHKMARAFPGKVKFLKSPEAVARTAPAGGLTEFLNQRVRWAGKWKNYTSQGPQLLAGFIFLFHLTFLAGWIGLFTGYLDPVLFLQQIVIKILFEFVFLNRVMALFGKKINILPFLIVELLYPLYVVLIVLLTFRGRYSWKGRMIKRLRFERNRI